MDTDISTKVLGFFVALIALSHAFVALARYIIPRLRALAERITPQWEGDDKSLELLASFVDGVASATESLEGIISKVTPFAAQRKTSKD